MPNRYFSSADYRYGFNGKEHDDELKTNSNSYDFGARMYDPRIGRWLAVDPQRKQYPYFSPYLGFGNSPIILIDPTGGVLYLGGDVNQALLDIQSLVPPEYRQAIYIATDGTIQIDRTKDWPSANDIANLKVGGDGGGYASYELIENLISAKERILYQVADKGIYWKGNEPFTVSLVDPDPNNYGNQGVLNESTTARYPIKDAALIKDKNGNVIKVQSGYIANKNKKPVGNDGVGYDGVVTLAKSGGWVRGLKLLSRSEVAFHELYENYARTVEIKPYRIPLYQANGYYLPTDFYNREPQWDPSQRYGSHFDAILKAKFSTAGGGDDPGVGNATRTLIQISPQNDPSER